MGPEFFLREQEAGHLGPAGVGGEPAVPFDFHMIRAFVSLALFAAMSGSSLACDEATEQPRGANNPPAKASPAVVPVPDHAVAYRENLRRVAEAFTGVRVSLVAELPAEKYRSAYLDAYLAVRNAHQILLDGLQPNDSKRPPVVAAAKAMARADELAAAFRRWGEVADAQPARARSLGESATALTAATDNMLAAQKLAREAPRLRASLLMDIYDFNDAMKQEGHAK